MANRNKKQNFSKNKFYRLNERINTPELRVIDFDGSNLGVISRDEAIEKAKAQELDLVEIAAQASPPVARIVDFQKFRYEENKKEQIAKKNTKEVELKEIWLTPRIAEHDLETRLRRAEEFIDDGNKILFRVKFKGREMGNLKLGFELLNKVYEKLGDKISIEREAKVEGRSITVIIGRSKAGPKQTETQESVTA